MAKELYRNSLTLKRLCEVLDYNPDSGLFRLRKSRGGVPAGKVAGYIHSSGYRYIRIDDKMHLAHRLAWFYVHGRWPKKNLDHINRNPSDNRIENLRECCQSKNGANRGKNKNNTSGFKGVSRHRGRWIAVIVHRRKRIHIGTFHSREEAHQAYVEKAKALFGEFAGE